MKALPLKKMWIWRSVFWLWGGRGCIDASEISRNQSLFCQTEPSEPETYHFWKKHKGPYGAVGRGAGAGVGVSNELPRASEANMMQNHYKSFRQNTIFGPETCKIGPKVWNRTCPDLPRPVLLNKFISFYKIAGFTK